MTAGPAFPFSALVGQDDLRTALLVNAVSPGVGGVLVRGEKGTAKSTAVRSLVGLLPAVEVVEGCPYSCDPAASDPDCPAGPHPADAPARRRPVRLVELPVGASVDRVAGSLDLERALVDGVRAFEPGLLAAAHRGVLYVDEANLLPDHVVDLLLDAAALGVNYVEREGVSVRHPARFLLVGTMNPEEGEIRPQLLDRFGISVDVRASREAAQRAEVVRRRLAFEADPAGFAARFEAEDRALGSQIAAARAALGGVALADRTIVRIAGACAALEVDGLRADIVTAKAAVALAALDGAEEVEDEHVRRAAMLALAHRRRRGPMDQPGLEPEELERALDGPDEEDEPPPDGDGSGRSSPGANGRGGAGPPAGDGPGPAEPREGTRTGGPYEEVPAPDSDTAVTGYHSRERDPPPRPAQATPAPTQVDAPDGRFTIPHLQLPGSGRGAAGRRSRSVSPTGRPVGDRALQGGDELAALATVRRAAPHQRARGRQGPGLALVRGDLRGSVREGREGNLLLFVVDASGSMAARRRMRAVKGAVLALLEDAYRRRDRVGMIAFRGAGAEVLLAPTASVEAGAAHLATLPTGGRTPLAAGLDAAAEIVRRERLRDPRRRALAFLVTDGRANAPAADPMGAAARAAAALVGAGAGLMVLDTEDGAVRLGMAAQLAAGVGAGLLRLDDLAAGALAAVVRGVQREAA